MIDDDILSPQAVADPYAFFAQLRENEPVWRSPRYRAWLITRYDDNAAAFKDLRFSSDRISPVIARERARQRPDFDLIQTYELLNAWLVFRNPPEHTRMRRLVHKAFTPRVIAALKEQVVAVTDELLDTAVANAGPDNQFDLIQNLAYPLPATIIAGMLGVPPQDRDRFKQWSDDISALVFGGMKDQDRHTRAQAGMGELVNYIKNLLTRVRKNPGENLASALVRARDIDDALTEEEAIAICVNLLFGGHETTTNLIGNSVLALLQQPEQRAKLLANPDNTSTAVEELVRYNGPAKAVARIAAEDIELRGHTITKGDRVFLLPSAANHDPAIFKNPDTLDITRHDNPHIGFGMGIHYCLGASLARLEASITIPRIFTRFPNLQLPPQQLTWNPLILTRGLTALTVQTAPVTPGA